MWNLWDRLRRLRRLRADLRGEEKQVLVSMAAGQRLRSHRYLDGTKIYLLHALEDDRGQPVAAETVASLRRRGLIESNMKFPVATYLLTDKGAALARRLTREAVRPLSSRNFPSGAGPG
ncbi:MAG: hypothetical protein KatS3mg050_3253 [Litorilinea sp.]|nr:MAG: hypothetical protein KatS3mg050_3253 [Litorilinea sp.]